jgi:DNA-binding LytR/AlgR family response regulator
MISCIAIDDEPLALDLLTNYCSQIEDLDLKKTFTRPSEARAYLTRFPVDLLFLDIQMPDISGIDFYISLKTDTPVIFTTAFSEYAVEGFNLSAIDYLLKPIKFTRFSTAVKKTREYIDFVNNRNAGNESFLFVRSEYRLMKIACGEIQYIQGLDNYVRIFIDGSKPVMSKITMKELTEKLPASFIRIHRSYIVNTSKSISYSNKSIKAGEKVLPVGSSYESDILRVFGLARD